MDVVRSKADQFRVRVRLLVLIRCDRGSAALALGDRGRPIGQEPSVIIVSTVYHPVKALSLESPHHAIHLLCGRSVHPSDRDRRAHAIGAGRDRECDPWKLSLEDRPDQLGRIRTT